MYSTSCEKGCREGTRVEWGQDIEKTQIDKGQTFDELYKCRRPWYLKGKVQGRTDLCIADENAQTSEQ